MKNADPERAQRGTETILLVEPDEAERSMTASMLATLGYRVIEARDAAEGLALHDKYAGVSLVVVEAHMTGINGHELAHMLAARNPTSKVLYLADADYERLARTVANREGLLFVARPYTLRTLAIKVRQALDSRSAARLFRAGGHVS